MVLDEYVRDLNDKGLNHIVIKNEKFIKNHYRWVILTDKTVLGKIKTGASMQFFLV